jgi:hypothetical protein
MYKADLEPVGFFSPKTDLPVEILGLAGYKSETTGRFKYRIEPARNGFA